MNSTVESVVNQVSGTAGTLVNNAGARVRKETSITGWASRLAAGGLEHMPDPGGRLFAEGVYILTEAELQAGCLDSGEVFIASDGYVRRSPRQPLVVPPGYRKRLIGRCILVTGVVLLAIVAAAVLIRLRVIAL